MAEGQVGEDAGGRIGWYQQRPPAALLSLTIAYVDPWTGRAAEPRLTGFEPWKDSRPGHCRRCYTEPAASCACPPVFRLDPQRVMSGVVAVYAVAGRLRIKDACRMYGEYIDEKDLAPEDIFIRDLLLYPGDAARFLERWMGGRPTSDSWTVGADHEQVMAAQQAALQLPASADPTAVHPLAPAEVGRLIAALAQAASCAHGNDFPPAAIAATELIKCLGIALATLERGSAVVKAQDLANTSAILNRTAKLLASEQWSPPRDLDSPVDRLIDALHRDASVANRLQTKLPRPACAFCGRTEPETGLLLISGDGCICEGCVRRAVDFLDEPAESEAENGPPDNESRLT